MSVSGLLEYYKKIIRPVLISQYHYNNLRVIPKIKLIMVEIFLDNLTGEEDWKIPMSLRLIGLLTGQKAVIKKMGWSGYGSRERKYQCHCFVTLRNAKAYDFLAYLIYIVYPIEIKRHGYPQVSVGLNGVYSYVFKDLNVFYRLGEDLIGYDPKIRIIIETTAIKKEECMSLLGHLGVPLKKTVTQKQKEIIEK